MAWSSGSGSRGGAVRVAALALALAAAWPLGVLAAPDGGAGRVAAAPLQPTAGEVLGLLAASDEETDPRRLAAALDLLRAAGPASQEIQEAVSRLLPYRSALYRDRDRLLVARLRAYLLATLAEIGFPRSAEPAVVDILAHVDEETPALELAAAARAVRALPRSRGRFFVPYLLEAIPLRTADEEITLERFAPDFPPAEATTPQLEAVRSLGWVVTAEDREAVALLARLAAYRGETLDPRLVEESRLALAAVADRGAESGGTVRSPGE